MWKIIFLKIQGPVIHSDLKNRVILLTLEITRFYQKYLENIHNYVLVKKLMSGSLGDPLVPFHYYSSFLVFH